MTVPLRPLRLGFAAFAALACACAGSHYDSWVEANPGWIDTFPDSGTSLHETLAGLEAPGEGGPVLEVQRVDVLRVSPSEAVRLSGAEVDAAIASGEAGHFGIVATLRCTSTFDGEDHEGERVGWLLLVDGRLRAYELPEFSFSCAAVNSFVPALQGHESLERQISGYRNAHFPRSDEYIAGWYEKGLAYVRVGRIEDAKWALDSGDAAANITDRSRPTDTFERPPRDPNVVIDPHVESAREALLQSLEAVHAELAAGQPTGP